MFDPAALPDIAAAVGMVLAFGLGLISGLLS